MCLLRKNFTCLLNIFIKSMALVLFWCLMIFIVFIVDRIVLFVCISDAVVVERLVISFFLKK